MKRSLKLPLFFMIVTIGVISIFQVYWLKKTYQEEKHLFGIRTNLLFRQTIMRLQAAKLHLDSNINIKLRDKEGILDMTNILQEKFVDSASHGKRMKTAVMITMDGFPGREAGHAFCPARMVRAMIVFWISFVPSSKRWARASR